MCPNPNKSFCQNKRDVLTHYTASQAERHCLHIPIRNNDKYVILPTSKFPHACYIADLSEFLFILPPFTQATFANSPAPSLLLHRFIISVSYSLSSALRYSIMTQSHETIPAVITLQYHKAIYSSSAARYI